MPKRKLTSLKLTHISAVNRPCQEGALAVIMKRRDDPEPSETARSIAKYLADDDDAKTFAEMLAIQEFDRDVWPMMDALQTSIRSIVADKNLSTSERESKITETVDQFLAAVRSRAPDADVAKIESELILLAKGEVEMPKTTEQLTQEVSDLTGQMTSLKAQLTALEKERDEAVAKAKQSDEDKKAMEAERDAAKAQLTVATDETISVGGQDIKKSIVGESQFMVMKALRDERDQTAMEKRAEMEFAHCPGTPAEKAQVLRAVAAIADEPTRKSFEAIMTSAEKMSKLGFERLGRNGGEQPESVRKSIDDFMGRVAEVAKRDSVPEYQAIQKVRAENPALFNAYHEALNGGEAAN